MLHRLTRPISKPTHGEQIVVGLGHNLMCCHVGWLHPSYHERLFMHEGSQSMHGAPKYACVVANNVTKKYKANVKFNFKPTHGEQIVVGAKPHVLPCLLAPPFITWEANLAVRVQMHVMYSNVYLCGCLPCYKTKQGQFQVQFQANTW